jgi:hypothetical protein
MRRRLRGDGRLDHCPCCTTLAGPAAAPSERTTRTTLATPTANASDTCVTGTIGNRDWRIHL